MKETPIESVARVEKEMIELHQEKIDKIYEVIANKELSFGCKIMTMRNQAGDYSFSDDMIWDDSTYSKLDEKLEFKDMEGEMRTMEEWIQIYDKITWNTTYWNNPTLVSYKAFDYKIIWHDVMIWTCDKLIKKWPDYLDDWNTILDLWIKKELPIESQSPKCIDFIHSLIK